MKTSLGQYLKKIRKEKRLTLRTVEHETGVSNSYLSQVENGKIKKPSPTVLLKLSNFYNVTFKHIMDLAGHPLPSTYETSLPRTQEFRRKSGFEDLTNEEKESVQEYIDFIRSRRRKS